MFTPSKNVTIILSTIIIFIFAIGIYYSPIFFKGYPTGKMAEEITIAKNYATSGIYGSESDLNVVLAPELLKTKANTSSIGNKFTPLSYALIFKLFGWQNWDKLILISVTLYALTTVIFMLTTYCLFGLEIALTSAVIYTLLPFNWFITGSLGQYEFALFYFSIFTLLYFGGRNKKTRMPYLLLAGIFLGISCLAREAMFVFLPILFLWLWLGKQKKELLMIFIPLCLLLAVFWLPATIGSGNKLGSNDNLLLFTVQGGNKYSDFRIYGHIYPDPYTYHFQKNKVIEQINNDAINQNNGLLYQLGQMKAGANFGVRKINLIERLMVGTKDLVRHISRFFAIEFIGGPVIFLLMLLGFRQLKQKNGGIYRLFLFWLVGTILILSYVILAARNHMTDFGWAIAVLTAMGLTSIRPVIKNYYEIKHYKIFYIIAVLLVSYDLILANHVYFGRAYDDTTNLDIKYIAEKVNNYPQKINPNDTIAVGDKALHPTLNYLTSKSVVFFHPDTIKELIGLGKLQQAFDEFSIKYVAGYDAEVSDLILKNSSSTDIANWPTREDIIPPISYNKEWLLNLIK